MKKLIWIMLVLMISSYTACHWDYHLSRYLFDQYCNDGRVGYEVFERVGLDKDYFLSVTPKEIISQRRDRRFSVGDNKIIDEEKFNEQYTFIPYKELPISDIGPISAIETSIIRNSDSKVLARAVSLANGLGWWIDSSGFGNRADTCPDGRDERGSPYYYEHHDTLMEKVFFDKTMNEPKK